ncbi:MAG: CHAD domain-containing protein [Actinomycetota bacterium]
MTTLSKPRQVRANAAEPPPTRFVLGADERAADGLARVLFEQVDLASFHAQHLSVSDGHVHELRKGTKRMRAVLRILRDEVDSGVYRDLNVSVRDVARSLSHVRTSIVMIDVFGGLVEERPALASATTAIRHELHADRDRARQSVDEALVGDLTRRLGGVRVRLGDAVVAGGGTITSEGVRRTYRRGRNGMARALASGSAEHFHAWRKRVKYLRHQLEVLSEVGSSDVTGVVDGLEGLGADLGRVNDLVDLTHRVTRSGPGREIDDGGEALLSVIGQARTQLEMDTRGPADRLFDRSPSMFVSELVPALA